MGAGVTWALHVGDCRTILPTLPRHSAAAGLWDPPSGLAFMGLEWDMRTAEVFAEFLRECFVAALHPLQPGAWTATWAHPQTSHWTALALERAGFEIESKIPWINAEAKPQPWRVGRLAPGHEEWIIAKAPGPRRPLSLRLWRDAAGGRHPRALVLGRGAGAALDSVVGRRPSGAFSGLRKADKHRNTFGTHKGTTAENPVAASDGGASRFFVSEEQLLAVYGPRARHCHRNLGPGGERSEHPTPKSVELLLPLIDLIAGEEALAGPVLDIFAGTGATGEAALLLGRPFIGIELGQDPRWPAEARARLARCGAEVEPEVFEWDSALERESCLFD